MARNSKLLAVTLASLLVLATFAPGALAATAANAAANTQVDVSTEAATGVTAEGATLNGNVTELNGSENATVAFQYWVAGDSENATTVEVGELPGEGEFSAGVSDLSPNTTYVYVATAEADNVTAVGAEQEFTTLEALDVSVETETPTKVTATNATFGGNLTAVEGTENATVSFRYYEQGERDSTNVLTLDEQSEGEFSTTVSDLSPNTTYVVVAQAEAERGNETAEATGASVNFITADATQPLGVETANATDVTNASATLNGELTGLNGSENASVSFEYWTADDPANSTNTTAVDLDSAGSFSADVSGLQNNTTYVYVAQAAGDNDTVTGEEETFTTGVSTDTNTTESGFEAPDGPLGQQVTAFIDYLRNETEKTGSEFGQSVAAFVTGNNPGADNRPDHAGPPWARDDADADGNETDDKRRGPPDDKGPDGDKERGPDGDKERGPDGDKERGPDGDKARGPK